MFALLACSQSVCNRPLRGGCFTAWLTAHPAQLDSRSLARVLRHPRICYSRCYLMICILVTIFADDSPYQREWNCLYFPFRRKEWWRKSSCKMHILLLLHIWCCTNKNGTFLFFLKNFFKLHLCCSQCVKVNNTQTQSVYFLPLAGGCVMSLITRCCLFFIYSKHWFLLSCLTSSILYIEVLMSGKKIAKANCTLCGWLTRHSIKMNGWTKS